MVSSIARSRSLYDIFLAHSGETQGFILAPGDDGKPLYRPGLAPDLSPQQRIDVFSYEHRNPTIDLPASFESFLYGAGFEDAPDSSELGSKGYHYSQGIDVSNGRRGYLSPEKQTGGTTTEAPLKIVSTSLGLFAMTARYVYENVSGTWTQRLDTGGSVTNTDLIELKNSNGTYLLLGVTGTSYYISVNGTAWTQPSANGSAPAYRASASASFSIISRYSFDASHFRQVTALGSSVLGVTSMTPLRVTGAGERFGSHANRPRAGPDTSLCLIGMPCSSSAGRSAWGSMNGPRSS